MTTDPTPAKCQLTLTAPPVLDAAGGTTSFAVTTEPECAWRASTGAVWISGLSPASGQGSATVQFRVAPNDGATLRESDILVESDRVHVSQRAPCRFDLAPASQTMSTAGGPGTVAVTASTDCPWTAVATAEWIAVTQPFTGSGSGVVRFTVAANGGAERTGSIIVGGQRSNITQAGNSPGPGPGPGPTCTYSIAPAAQNIATAGGAGSPIAVSAPGGCPWTATSNASWIAVSSGASGTGSGSVAFNVAGNIGALRTGTLTIGGQTAMITQAACTYTIAPTSQGFTAVGGVSVPVVVSTLGTCQWATVSNAPWIVVATGAAGAGNGSATFVVAANVGPARTGSLTIAGQPFTVTQEAPCTQILAPSSQTFGASGGDGSIAVASAIGCQWTSSSNAAWLTIQSGVTGSGSGRVEYRVESNSGGARSGTITIGNATFTVTQTGS